MEKKKVEFPELIQGNMTMEDFEANFAKLSRYGPNIIDLFSTILGPF